MIEESRRKWLDERIKKKVKQLGKDGVKMAYGCNGSLVTYENFKLLLWY